MPTSNQDQLNKIRAGFERLRQPFIEIQDIARIRSAHRITAEDMHRLLLARIQETAPGTQVENIPGGTIPRKRISAKYPEYAGPSLNEAGAFQENITDTDTGVKYALGSLAVHLKWLTKGTPSHAYFARSEGSYLHFWWGAPYRWAPTYPPESDRGPGGRRFPMINHPGIQPNPFIQNAVDLTYLSRSELFSRANRWLLFAPFYAMAGRQFVGWQPQR